ncbi:UNVERIFIED_CONTAM: hypothetical protein Scaly_1865500 [Sesamum calycinum]|uniref:Uncharacterized protein n=1 Tax=Sesamum calycinum TaxID=2727403 RepID=A0AAW2NER7_9LAMI
MGFMALIVKSAAKTMGWLVAQPAATLATVLYYSGVLPRNLNLDRFVQHELLEPDNFLFRFLVHFLSEIKTNKVEKMKLRNNTTITDGDDQISEAQLAHHTPVHVP